MTAPMIRRRLAELADPVRAEKVRRVVPGARTLGIAVPDLRALARELKTLPFEHLCALLDDFAAGGSRDEFLVGIFAVGGAPKRTLATLPWARVARWARAVDNWETCDQLGACIAAPRIHVEPALARNLEPFTGAASPWHRRFALATAAALNQKGRWYPDVTLELCAVLAKDPDPMIRKSREWALRELEKARKRA